LFDNPAYIRVFHLPLYLVSRRLVTEVENKRQHRIDGCCV